MLSIIDLHQFNCNQFFFSIFQFYNVNLGSQSDQSYNSTSNHYFPDHDSQTEEDNDSQNSTWSNRNFCMSDDDCDDADDDECKSTDSVRFKPLLIAY